MSVEVLQNVCVYVCMCVCVCGGGGGGLVRTGSVMETQTGFRHEMNRHEAPSPIAIR